MSHTLVLHKVERHLPSGEQILARRLETSRPTRQARRYQEVVARIAEQSGHTQASDLTLQELKTLIDVFDELDPTYEGKCTNCGSVSIVYSIHRFTRSEVDSLCRECIDAIWSCNTEIVKDLDRQEREKKKDPYQRMQSVGWGRGRYITIDECDLCTELLDPSICDTTILPHNKEQGDATPDWEDFDFRYAVENKVWYFVHRRCRDSLVTAFDERVAAAAESAEPVADELPIEEAPIDERKVCDEPVEWEESVPSVEDVPDQEPTSCEEPPTCEDSRSCEESAACEEYCEEVEATVDCTISEWSEAEVVETPESTILGDVLENREESANHHSDDSVTVMKVLVENQKALLARFDGLKVLEEELEKRKTTHWRVDSLANQIVQLTTKRKLERNRNKIRELGEDIKVLLN